MTLVSPLVSLGTKGRRRTALRAFRLLILPSKDLDRTPLANSIAVFQHSFCTAGVTLQIRFYLTNGCVKRAEIEAETDTNGRQIEDVYVGMGRWGNGM